MDEAPRPQPPRPGKPPGKPLTTGSILAAAIGVLGALTALGVLLFGDGEVKVEYAVGVER